MDPEARAQQIDDARDDGDQLCQIIIDIANEDPFGGGADVLDALERRGLRG
ncbi:hypothetical protein [Streptomyces olivaceiscleroticus]|uniref:Uncharacterized protein n=1 Tax=Streptomyces olivaceiscleroticus TaxID=68245 RepID=A0ABP3LJP1_9ACTN